MIRAGSVIDHLWAVTAIMSPVMLQIVIVNRVAQPAVKPELRADWFHLHTHIHTDRQTGVKGSKVITISPAFSNVVMLIYRNVCVLLRPSIFYVCL